jgi:hypothetical protein
MGSHPDLTRPDPPRGNQDQGKGGQPNPGTARDQRLAANRDRGRGRRARRRGSSSSKGQG